jgi:hypothetical protein
MVKQRKRMTQTHLNILIPLKAHALMADPA